MSLKMEEAPIGKEHLELRSVAQTNEQHERAVYKSPFDNYLFTDVIMCIDEKNKKIRTPQRSWKWRLNKKTLRLKNNRFSQNGSKDNQDEDTDDEDEGTDDQDENTDDQHKRTFSYQKPPHDPSDCDLSNDEAIVSFIDRNDKEMDPDDNLEMKVEEKRIEAEKSQVKEESLQLARILETVGAFEVKCKVGEGKQILGSVTAQDLVDIIKAQLQRDIDTSIVSLPEIQETGEYIAEFKLHPDVSAQVRLNVSINYEA